MHAGQDRVRWLPRAQMLTAHFENLDIHLKRPDGRITLSDMRLIVSGSGKRRELVIADNEEYVRVLKTHFGIDILMKDFTLTGTL